MSHVLTIGDILIAGAAVLAVISCFGFLISFLASKRGGWNL